MPISTRRGLLLCSTALFVSAMPGCSSGSGRVEAAAKPAGVRKAAPDFALRDLNGSTAKLSDYRGKVVLLNFWATWCGPCKVEIPWFIEFEQTYRDRGFAVLGVAMDDEGWEVVKPYIESRKINYRVMLGNDRVAQQYGGVDSLPTTFLIDREGRIAATHIGLVSRRSYEDDIRQLLDDAKGNQRAAR